MLSTKTLPLTVCRSSLQFIIHCNMEDRQLRIQDNQVKVEMGVVTLQGEDKGPSVTSWRSFANISFLSEMVKGLIIPLINTSGCHTRQRKAAQTSFRSFRSTTSRCSLVFYHPFKADEALWTSDCAERPQTHFSLHLVVC